MLRRDGRAVMRTLADGTATAEHADFVRHLDDRRRGLK
jgi:hypothetical protein